MRLRKNAMYAQGAEAQRRIFNAKYRLSGTRRKRSQSNDERAGRSLDSLAANNITQAISKKHSRHQGKRTCRKGIYGEWHQTTGMQR